MSVASLFIQPTSFQTVVDNYIMFRRLFIRIIRLILVRFVCDNKQHFYFFIIFLFFSIISTLKIFSRSGKQELNSKQIQRITTREIDIIIKNNVWIFQIKFQNSITILFSSIRRKPRVRERISLWLKQIRIFRP